MHPRGRRRTGRHTARSESKTAACAAAVLLAFGTACNDDADMPMDPNDMPMEPDEMDPEDMPMDGDETGA